METGNTYLSQKAQGIKEDLETLKLDQDANSKIRNQGIFGVANLQLAWMCTYCGYGLAIRRLFPHKLYSPFIYVKFLTKKIFSCLHTTFYHQFLMSITNMVQINLTFSQISPKFLMSSTIHLHLLK